MFFLPVTLIFLGYGTIQLIFTLQNHKEKRQKNFFINELILCFLFFITGLLFPLMYQSHNPSLDPDILNFLWASTSTIILIEEFVWGLVILYDFLVCKKNPSLKTERGYENFKKKFILNWHYDFRKDIERKLIHLVPVIVIFLLWTLGSILDANGLLALWNIDVFSFSYWLIVTIGFGFVLMFTIADLLKLKKTYLLPKWAIRWYRKSMMPEELETYVASTPLVLSFVPFLFAPFPIFASVALITSVSDAAASLIGKKYGKHKFFEKSEKTVEGYIAGFVSTFILVFLTTIIYNTLMPVDLGTILVMASVASLIFLMIDIFAKGINDNILNPILTGFGMWAIILIF